MDLLQEIQQEVLERLGRVGIAARQAVESLLAGQHRSLRQGLSVEFSGHRLYQTGDDLRHLDWLVYARTDRYNVRVYEEEERLRATVVMDCSGSMAYGAAGRSKLDYARMLSGALGFLMLRQSDAVGLALVDHEVRELHPPSSTMGNLLALLERLENTPTGGETSLGAVLDALAERLNRRGLVILVSDLFDDPERLVQALRHLRYRKQEVRVFQVIDPDEETLPFQGMRRFVGLEREEELRLDADRVRPHYQQMLREHRQRVAEGCHSCQIALETCRTDEDLAMVLVRALARPLEHGQRS